METVTVKQDNNPISKILIIMAMQHEAAPIIEKFGLKALNAFEIGLLGPMLPYHGTVQIGETKGDVYLLLNGESHVREQCGTLRQKEGAGVKVNRVGVVPAALSTWEGIRIFKPDLILSVGTAGGVHARGIRQRQVYLSENPVQYYDRLIDFRAPGDEFEVTNYKCFGIGSHPVLPCKKLAAELNIPFAKVGTGSSFAHPEGNVKVQHDENAVAVKEMECAAIAEVADIFNIPFLAVKGVTDYVDIHTTTESLNDEFSSNLGPVSDLVAESTVKIINFMLGKTVSDL